MAETLGMLCDKLTIVKLKQFHTEDAARLNSLGKQAKDLQDEIDNYISDAVAGKIQHDKLVFEANKVFKEEGNKVQGATGDFGEIFYTLAEVNCLLWHEQEKVYEFEKVPVSEKDNVVKQLALLNLQRNNCIDAINKKFAQLVIEKSN